MMRTRSRPSRCPIQIPIGAEEHFRGMIDLIEMKAVIFDDERQGLEDIDGEIPDDLVERPRSGARR